MFHNLHRGQRYTRLCPYLVYCAMLYSLPLPHLRESSVLLPPLYSSIPPSSVSATTIYVSLSPRQVNYCLFPPPHPYPFPPLPLRCLTQVQNWSRHNILRGRILPTQNVGFHRFKPRLLSRRLCQCVLPPLVKLLRPTHPRWQKKKIAHIGYIPSPSSVNIHISRHHMEKYFTFKPRNVCLYQLTKNIAADIVSHLSSDLRYLQLGNILLLFSLAIIQKCTAAS